MMITDIFLNILLQTVYFVGNVFLIGFVIDRLNRLFYRTVGNSRAVCYATGIIGTPIHELSHALMCVLFGKKITKIVLFQPADEMGRMGYVEFAGSEKNLYARFIGNYFVGTAPVLSAV